VGLDMMAMSQNDSICGYKCMTESMAWMRVLATGTRMLAQTAAVRDYPMHDIFHLLYDLKIILDSSAWKSCHFKLDVAAKGQIGEHTSRRPYSLVIIMARRASAKTAPFW
jgi:hypothetical protein